MPNVWGYYEKVIKSIGDGQSGENFLSFLTDWDLHRNDIMQEIQIMQDRGILTERKCSSILTKTTATEQQANKPSSHVNPISKRLFVSQEIWNWESFIRIRLSNNVYVPPLHVFHDTAQFQIEGFHFTINPGGVYTPIRAEPCRNDQQVLERRGLAGAGTYIRVLWHPRAPLPSRLCKLGLLCLNTMGTLDGWGPGSSPCTDKWQYLLHLCATARIGWNP